MVVSMLLHCLVDAADGRGGRWVRGRTYSFWIRELGEEIDVSVMEECKSEGELKYLAIPWKGLVVGMSSSGGSKLAKLMVGESSWAGSGDRVCPDP